MSTTPTTPTPQSLVLSHIVDAERLQAIITLQDAHGRKRMLQINLGSGRSPCSQCGRGFQLTTAGAADVSAIVSAELTAMDAEAANVVAYLAANPTAKLSGGTP